MPAPKDAAKARAKMIRQQAKQRLVASLRALFDELRVGQPDLTQGDAAELMGIPQGMLSRYLAGTMVPKADVLALVCVLTGRSADAMLGLSTKAGMPAMRPQEARMLLFAVLNREERKILKDVLNREDQAESFPLDEAEAIVTPTIPPPARLPESSAPPPVENDESTDKRRGGPTNRRRGPRKHG